MINRNDWVEDFQKNISELISRSPAGDIERNLKAFMAQAFSRLDLVTREEFDIQAQLLERALQRVTALESRLDQFEGRHSTTSAMPVEPAVATTPVEPAATTRVEPPLATKPVGPSVATTPVQPGVAPRMPDTN